MLTRFSLPPLFRRAAALVFLTVLTVASLFPARAQDEGDAPEPRGPTGWETYRQLNRLPLLTRGVDTRMFSSFDRTDGNDDGFGQEGGGTYSCLRQTNTGCVIAEASGPGEIQSLWFTSNAPDRRGGYVGRLGNIVIELDGEEVVNRRLQDLVNGDAGAPFKRPLVANANQTSGGVYVKVPMPYRESMRVTLTGTVNFHHVVYRTFASAEGIETFDPSEPAQDVIDTFADAGFSDPKDDLDGETTTENDFALPAGESATLAELSGPGLITTLQLRIPQLVASIGPITDDGRAFNGSNGESTFTVSIDPDNEGVELTRRYGAAVARQEANVFVDGEQVATWEPQPASSGRRWRNQSVELPTSVTGGKSEVRIRNVFVSSGGPDFNEFTYFVESRVDGNLVPTDTVDVGPNSTANENAHDYEITGQSFQGVRRDFLYTVGTIKEREDEILPTDTLLEHTRLQISFDGEKTVDAPLGEFFGTGLGQYEVRSLFFAVNTRSNRLTTWWPMPFAESATVRLVNNSSVDLREGTVRLTSASGSQYAKRLSSGRFGYFHATARRGQAPGRESDWVFLDKANRHGKYVGVSHTMFGQEHTGKNLRAYLEGDFRAYLDASRTPQLYGTGSEDYYEGGWYFNRNAFNQPLNGNPGHEDFQGGAYRITSTNPPADTAGTLGCRYSCDSAYRLMIGDAVPFGKAARLGMENGPENNFHATYSSTAFWYGREPAVLKRTDVLDVGDETSEEAHAYTSERPTEVETVTDQSFEGDLAGRLLREDLRATSAPVSFTMDVTPEDSDSTAQGGAVLRRLSDQLRAYQEARVFVDGEKVGTWLQPLGNRSQRWLEDSYQLPAEVIAGKEQITVRLEPVDDAPAWTAGRYELLTYQPSATGTSNNKIPNDTPQEMGLLPNHPNPFSERTSIRFRVDKPQSVQLTVYDAQGRRVRTLADRPATAGVHAMTWQPSSGLASGIYFLRLRGNSDAATRAITLLR
jgi:hypothetical protein